MLIVCWPLLSAVPRPYILSPSITIFHGERPGAPLIVLAADHVAMAVGQHGRLGGVLDPAGDQERAVFAARVGQHRAVVAELAAATPSSRRRHTPAGPASSRSPGWWSGSPPAAAAPRGSRHRRNTSLRARWRHPVCRSWFSLPGSCRHDSKIPARGRRNADIGPHRFQRDGRSPSSASRPPRPSPSWSKRQGAARVFLMVSGTLNRETDEIEKVRRALGNKCVGTFDKMPAHSPRAAMIAAAEQAREARADLIVTLGGGSITDGAKAVQLCLANDVRTVEDMDRIRGQRRREAADRAADLDPDHALGRRVLRPSPASPTRRTKVKEMFRHPLTIPQAVDPRSRGDAPHADVAPALDRHPRRRSLRRGRLLQRIDGVHQRLVACTACRCWRAASPG